jgi:HEAT repeat protein
MPLLVFLVLLASNPLAAQVTRPKEVRELAKGGSDAIPQLQALLKNPDLDIRIEAVKAIVEVGTQRSLDPLIEATADADAEVQIRAADGLVNFYLAGYVRTGLGARLQRAGKVVKAKFTDTNDQVIDPYIQVRPEVIAALGKLARGGISMESRANAARAVGILRGQAAIPDLLEAMKSKDGAVLYESLIAIQKIRDRGAAPAIRYLLRDLDERVQVAAIETTGILQYQDALPDVVEALNRARTPKVRRAALTSIAMIPAESSRALFNRYLSDKEDSMRAAAAEGFGRLRNPADLPAIEKAFEQEGKASPRLSMAFAMVSLGKVEVSEFSPLQLLVNTLNSRARQGEAFPLLIELARQANIRASLYPAMAAGTKDEKTYLARVLARSGDQDSLPALEKASHDLDPDVAQEGVRSLQNLKARLAIDEHR